MVLIGREFLETNVCDGRLENTHQMVQCLLEVLCFGAGRSLDAWVFQDWLSTFQVSFKINKVFYGTLSPLGRAIKCHEEICLIRPAINERAV